jgi:hypothetical protein
VRGCAKHAAVRDRVGVKCGKERGRGRDGSGEMSEAEVDAKKEECRWMDGMKERLA